MTVCETEGVVASKKLRIAMLGHNESPGHKLDTHNPALETRPQPLGKTGENVKSDDMK